MAIYLRLFHGRDAASEKLDDWGFNGPVIGPLKYCHVTYMSDVKFAIENAAFRKLFPEKTAEWEAAGVSNLNHEWVEHYMTVVEDLVVFQGKFYGDFSVTAEAE